MNKHANKLSALLVSLTLGVTSNTVMGQESEQVLEEVVVTGTRIARTGTSTPIPVTMLDSETISLSGDTKIADLVNELPSLRTTQSPANTNFSEQEAGTNFLDLRGLGIDRTLVLVNGRRQVGGRPGSAAMDTNTIPTALVERVEIITGGASAVYGADAVSGVVNFIMKDDFEGLQFDLQSGRSGEGDGEGFQISITGGANFEDDKGNIYFNLTRDDSGKVVGIDRDYANQRIRFATNPNNTGPNDGIPDQILFSNTGFISTPPSGLVQFPNGSGGASLREDLGGPFTFDANGNLVQQDTGILVESFLSVGGNNAGNLSANDLLQVPVERTLFSTGMTYDITDELSFFVDAKYAQSLAKTAQQTSFTLPGVEPIFIQIDNPYVPQTLVDTLNAESLDGFFVSRTNRDHGKRRSKSDRDTVQFYTGVEGLIGDTMDYSVHYQYGRTDVSTEFINRQVPSRFQQALDVIADPVTSEPVCRDASNGCVPFNVLGPNTATPEAIAWAFSDFTSTGVVEQDVLNFTMTGDSGGFEFSGGPIGFAAGLEYREESAETKEGHLRNIGDIFNSPPIDNIAGEFDVKEVFAEINLPLIAGAPFIEELNLDAAVRAADYSTVGKTTSWKIGGDWAPTTDVRFRFTTSTAVRAPNIGELFAPSGVSNIFLIDPCDTSNVNSGSSTRQANCTADGVPAGFLSQSLNRTNTVVTGGNEDLIEEEADTLTFGVVITPEALPGLSVTIDYWDIEIEGAINSFPAQAIINNCYDAADLNNPFCALVSRQANSQFDEVQSTLINVASFEATGIDIEATYLTELGEGDLKLSLMGTLLDELTFYGQEDSVGDEEAGELGDPENVFTLRSIYSLGGFTFSFEERYISGQAFDLAEPSEVRSPNSTPDVFYTDVQFRYQFDDQKSLYFGIDNLFDKAPPKLVQVPETRSFTGDAIVYDQMGRYFNLGLSVAL